MGTQFVLIFVAAVFSVLSTTSSFASTGNVYLLVSVDWEGESLRAENLKAIQKFRDKFPQLKLLHFLNAAYFTQPGAEVEAGKRKISSALRPGDELGLHIHNWKSLVEAAGVSFKDSPTYWGYPLNRDGNDQGHEVAPTAYSQEEFRRVVHFSLETLEKQGFGRAKSFRTGGWLGAPSILSAIAQEGLTLDSSAVPASFLKGEIGNTPLYRWVAKLWPGIGPSSQPEKIKTSAGWIWEMPDNGALADYMEASEMVSVFQTGVSLLRQRDGDVYVQIGFHQETAEAYLPRVQSALHSILDLAKSGSIPLEFVPLPLTEALNQ